MKRIIALILFLAITLSILNTFAVETPQTNKQESEKAAPEARLWNLQDADILSVINEVSLETGKNFVVDPRVSGKISLISSKPIKPNQVYDIFLSVLGLLGYSAIPNGNVVKIVPNMESSEHATRVANSTNPGRGDEVVVRIIPLENVTANQIIPIIRPMLPQWSNVSSYTPGNILILIGRAGNLTRIVDVIRRVDKATSTNIDVIPLHRANAAQVAAVLTNLQSAGRANGDVPQVSIAADERTNSILLGGNQAARAHMKILVSELDTPTSGSQGNTEVIYLKYLQAKTFAPILGKIAQNIQGKDTSGDKDAAATTTTNTATAKPKANENRTSIQAEPSTNSIIITAAPSLMSALRSIVSKLDIRPAQVLVEAVIVELDMDGLKKLGIQWGTNLNRLGGSNSVNPANTPPGATIPSFGEGIIGIIPNTPINAILSVLQSKSGVNILSTPSVVVLDNHKAVLSVGQNIAEQTGSYVTNGSTTTNPFNTVERKDVVLKLAVIPQINLNNSVRLTMAISNDTLQNPLNPGLNPTINTSKIQNSVIVNSCDILVVGGLMSNTLSESIDKIPFLSEIPLLGNLFKHTIHEYQKKNLVIFIKPIIMTSSEDADLITHTKYNLTRVAQVNQPADIMKDKESKLDYILPLWKNDVNLPKPFEG